MARLNIITDDNVFILFSLSRKKLYLPPRREACDGAWGRNRMKISRGKLAGILVAAMLLTTTLIALPQVTDGAPAASQKRGAISLTFDDGSIGQYTTAYALMNAANLDATLFVPTTFIGVDNYVTLDQIKEMNSNGWEIASHTYSHQSLTEIPAEQAQAELTNSKAQMDAWGFDCQTIAYPNSMENVAVRDMAQTAGYTLQRSSDGLSHYYASVPSSVRLIKAMEVGTWSAITEIIDRAVATDSAAVIIFHGINDDGTVQYWDGTNTDITIQKLISYIQKKQAEGLEVLTFKQLIGYHAETTKEWIATTSGSISDGKNWKGGVAPAEGDSMVFSHLGTGDAIFDNPAVFGDILVTDEYTGAIRQTVGMTFASVSMDSSGSWVGSGDPEMQQVCTSFFHIGHGASLADYSVSLVMYSPDGYQSYVDVSNWQPLKSLRAFGDVRLEKALWTWGVEVGQDGVLEAADPSTPIIVPLGDSDRFFLNYGKILNGSIDISVYPWYYNSIRIGQTTSDVSVTAYEMYYAMTLNVAGAISAKSLKFMYGYGSTAVNVQLDAQNVKVAGTLTVGSNVKLLGGATGYVTVGGFDAAQGRWTANGMLLQLVPNSSTVSLNTADSLKTIEILLTGKAVDKWTIAPGSRSSYSMVIVGDPSTKYSVKYTYGTGSSGGTVSVTTNADGRATVTVSVTSYTSVTFTLTNPKPTATGAETSSPGTALVGGLSASSVALIAPLALGIGMAGYAMSKSELLSAKARRERERLEWSYTILIIAGVILMGASLVMVLLL